MTDEDKAVDVLDRMSKVADEIEKSAAIAGIVKDGDPNAMTELELIAQMVDGGQDFVEMLIEELDDEKRNSFLSGVCFGVLAERGRVEKIAAMDPERAADLKELGER